MRAATGRAKASGKGPAMRGYRIRVAGRRPEGVAGRFLVGVRRGEEETLSALYAAVRKSVRGHGFVLLRDGFVLPPEQPLELAEEAGVVELRIERRSGSSSSSSSGSSGSSSSSSGSSSSGSSSSGSSSSSSSSSERSGRGGGELEEDQPAMMEDEVDWEFAQLHPMLMGDNDDHGDEDNDAQEPPDALPITPMTRKRGARGGKGRNSAKKKARVGGGGGGGDDDGADQAVVQEVVTHESFRFMPPKHNFETLPRVGKEGPQNGETIAYQVMVLAGGAPELSEHRVARVVQSFFTGTEYVLKLKPEGVWWPNRPPAWYWDQAKHGDEDPSAVFEALLGNLYDVRRVEQSSV